MHHGELEMRSKSEERVRSADSYVRADMAIGVLG